MDLTREKWLPVVLYSGKHTKIALTELLDNQIRDVAYPRSDFQGCMANVHRHSTVHYRARG